MNARIWNDAGWIKETDPKTLRVTFDVALKEAGFNILEICEHHFSPFGYTVLYLLSESHFALHTFPEFGKTYYEISSCNKPYFLKFLDSIDKENIA